MVGREAVDADSHADCERLHDLLRPQELQRQDLEVGVVKIVDEVGEDQA